MNAIMQDPLNTFFLGIFVGAVFTAFLGRLRK